MRLVAMMKQTARPGKGIAPVSNCVAGSMLDEALITSKTFHPWSVCAL